MELKKSPPCTWPIGNKGGGSWNSIGGDYSRAEESCPATPSPPTSWQFRFADVYKVNLLAERLVMLGNQLSCTCRHNPKRDVNAFLWNGIFGSVDKTSRGFQPVTRLNSLSDIIVFRILYFGCCVASMLPLSRQLYSNQYCSSQSLAH